MVRGDVLDCGPGPGAASTVPVFNGMRGRQAGIDGSTADLNYIRRPALGAPLVLSQAVKVKKLLASFLLHRMAAGMPPSTTAT